MLRTFCLLFTFFLASFLAAEPYHILVSVSPEAFLVKKITQETAIVEALVPLGASPHTYDPTLKQLMRYRNARVWFQIGEPFERRTAIALREAMPQLQFVDLSEGLPLLHSSCHCCKGDHDTHIWLSPKLLALQAKRIAAVLSQLFPEYGPLYEKNLSALLVEITLLDQELERIFSQGSAHLFLVSHPAFGYLCRDYHLQQLSIEYEGKEPSPRQLLALLEQARLLGLRRIFIEPQYQNKGAIVIARELNATLVTVDPYSPDLFNNLKAIAQALSQF